MTQPRSLAICLERLHAADAERFVQCVALPGGRPGLTLDASGMVAWQSAEPAGACELWVSMDEQLIVRRPAGACDVELERAGRCLALPADKPVVLIDDDRLTIGALSFCVHIHGYTDVVTAPRAFVPEPPRSAARGARATATAAALALGAAMSFGGVQQAEAGKQKPPAKPPVEIRDKPPEPPAMPDPPKKPKKPNKPNKPNKPKKPEKKDVS